MDGVTVNRGTTRSGLDQFGTTRPALDQLGDEALLASTRRLVGQSNQTLALLLAHLAEVEARGIHRARACASLYTFCIYELRMSEDAAYRRAKAARLCRKVPALYDCVAAGELHLTGLLMLGPHLTEENHADVLARAKHRTKREIAKLVRQLDPLPDAPARVEPLGPEAGIATPRAPAWSAFVASFNAVRELAPGERPADWVREGADGGEPGNTTSLADLAVRAGALDAASRASAGPNCVKGVRATEPLSTVGATAFSSGFAQPQRYKVQFTASQEYVDLLERARDLLAHAVPGRSIAEVHLRALRELVARLERKKCGAPERPRRGADPREDVQGGDARMEPGNPRQRDAGAEGSARHGARSAEPRHRVASGPQRESAVPRRRDNNLHDAAPANPRRRDAVLAAVRRAVWERDGARCTFVDARGQRCRETALLELHHEQPFARGGSATAANLTLRCRAHNAFAAERDFGRAFMEATKGRALPDG